jgi:hypothetical protein
MEEGREREKTKKGGGWVGGNKKNMEKHNIWTGVLEWHEKLNDQEENVIRAATCQVFTKDRYNSPEVTGGDSWPQKLVMQLIPSTMVGNIGGDFFANAKTVLVTLQLSDASTNLTRQMQSGQWAGCVYFTDESQFPCSSNIRLLILLYSSVRHAYLGFIPNEQDAFAERIRVVMEEEKNRKILEQQQQTGDVLRTRLQNNGQVQGEKIDTLQAHLLKGQGQRRIPETDMDGMVTSISLLSLLKP